MNDEPIMSVIHGKNNARKAAAKQIPAAEVARLAREIECARVIDGQHLCKTIEPHSEHTCRACNTRRELLHLCGEE